jgi:predicted N-formylglutamate amidohydrolase
VARPQPRSVVLTCEHATWRAPAGSGLDPALCRSHVGWDAGALALADALAAALGVPVLPGTWTRLLVDLNRSADTVAVVPTRSFGVEVPANAIDGAARALRIATWWAPFRAAARGAVARGIDSAGAVAHLSIHSFDPGLEPGARGFDLGVLFDPSRPGEAALAARIVAQARARGLDARENAPYLGTDDGHTTALRAAFGDPAYAGIELELSQASLGRAPRVVEAVLAALGQNRQPT